MAKTTNRLTAIRIRNLTDKGLYADGPASISGSRRAAPRAGFSASRLGLEPAIWGSGHTPK